MQSTQVNEFTPATSLLQVGSYFDIVDNAVKTGDTNKRYTMSSNAATAPSAPIRNGSFTSVIISPTADNMCDLYNSFLDVKLKVSVANRASTWKACNYTITVPGPATELDENSSESEDPPPNADISVTAAKHNQRGIWVGYKDSMDAIEQYSIIVNGQSIYTQNYAIEESYITNLATTDAVKKSDVYSKTRLTDVWKTKNTFKSGVVYKIPDVGMGVDAPTQDLEIKLKIDIRRFLPLSNIKYLPKFVGNFELRIKFSTAGLVYAPLPLSAIIKNPGNVAGLLHKDAVRETEITSCFVPFGEPLTTIDIINFTGWNAGLVSTVDNETLILKNFEVTSCYSVLHQFGLDASVYQALMQRYSQTALAFPTQTLSFQPMNGNLSGGSNGVSLTLTTTPRFVDSIFILFPLNNTYRTVYFNPLITDWTLKMGGYGQIPDLSTDTSNSPKFYELCSNALNMNNDLAGFNEDVVESISGARVTTIGPEPYDCSNFFIGIPVETDHTFQQGQTSNSAITYDFRGNVNTNSMYLHKEPTLDPPYPGQMGMTASPLMGFLKDSVLAIQLREGGTPIISLDEFDISSPS